jgi:thiamine-phosphate pyrophosphorylase
MTLTSVYPIVDSAEWVGRLLPFGIRLVQLRIKVGSAAEVRSEIRKAKRLCSRAGAQLIVNDYWLLAMAEGCDFVHLGQGDLDTADVPALRKAGIRIGISTHDDTELTRALALRPDYVALGPIYPTSLKVMPWSPQGLERVAEWKRRIGKTPLVAIGGLTAERLAGVFNAGADIAAVVSDIVRNPDPEARTREWLATAARHTHRPGRTAAPGSDQSSGQS